MHHEQVRAVLWRISRLRTSLGKRHEKGERNLYVCDVGTRSDVVSRMFSVSTLQITNGKCARYGVDEVGTVPAALNTYIAIKHVNPDLIINAGTAGGFRRKDAAIGRTPLSTAVLCNRWCLPVCFFCHSIYFLFASFPLPQSVLFAGMHICVQELSIAVFLEVRHM